MACLDENLIVAFFAPGRPAEVVARVEAHTATCEKCRALLAAYAQMSAGQGTARLDPGLAATPSLTPPNADPTEPEIGAELVQRLVHAQASKRIGTTLKGKWQIESLLGMGGMALVFAARHRNGRRVAIKCMRPELALEPSLVERFLREGYVANKIEHPGAVAILDDDITEDGTPFLVMELLLGKTLREHVANGPLALDEALRVTSDVLDVLAAAHEKGIVHRDLKPDNLFQTESGEIKVLDFGIARLKERTRPELDTRSGVTMGTIGYMPPEQARGLTAEVDARTDVWAIGATLYALLTARTLHEAATTNEALLLAMTTPVPPMRDLLPGLPVSVQTVLDRALAFTKTDRYESARAMRSALEAARAGLGDTLLVASRPPPPLVANDTADPAVARTASATLLERAMARRGASSPSDRQPEPRTRVAWMLGIAAAAVAIAAVVVVVVMARGPRGNASSVPPAQSTAAPATAPPATATATATATVIAITTMTEDAATTPVILASSGKPSTRGAPARAPARGTHLPPAASSTAGGLASPPAAAAPSQDPRDPLGPRH